jgi:uncharacterized protein YdeI (YjbR/CyaY-like superfamily)
LKPTSVSEYLSFGCGRCPLGNTPDCKVHTWSAELILLRSLISESELTEHIKWGIPCYTFKDKNVLTLSAMKNECVISFFKGSLMKDHHGILTPAGPNSHESRVIRFTDLHQIQEVAPFLSGYIRQAIDIEESGQKIAPKPVSDYKMPEELMHFMTEDPDFKKAFLALTPGRQKGYLIHFSAPKKADTRISRIERCRDRILQGKGIQDI